MLRPLPSEQQHEVSTMFDVPRRRRRFGPAGAVLLVVALAAVWFTNRAGPQLTLAGDVPWAQEWNDAVRRSQATRKPALVLFTADWCPGCRWFESNTLVRGDVRGVMESRYTPIKVDLTSQDSPNQFLAQQYKIEAIPTLIRYDANGREVARTHALGPDELMAWLGSDGRKAR
jgi:thiol:disulfide interchange protein